MRRRVTSRAGVLAGTLAALALALSACGADKQDENEPEGEFKVDVISASFPGRQHLADEVTLKLEIQNKDSRAIPTLAVTVDGFTQRRDDATLAESERPVWILNTPPHNSRSALTNTWTVGPVPAGQTRTLNWNVTAVRAGTYSVRYRVAAGLDGKAVAESFDGSGPAKGSFIARVSRAPRPLEEEQ
ncbi:MAG: hypothetical protein ACRDLQ_04185 [Solirubrobacterales bacterium]